VGLGIIFQVSRNYLRLQKVIDQTKEIFDDFDAQLKRIEYQTARLVELSNIENIMVSQRNLLQEKSLDLMTAIVKYFDSTLLFRTSGLFRMALTCNN